jgi:DNA-binding Lrp family transcriptional regulator
VSDQAITTVFDTRDQRLIAALQCDGRVTAEHAASVLGLSTRMVRRRCSELLDSKAIRVAGVPELPEGVRGMLVRIRVLRGRLDAIANALAVRDDVPMIDTSAAGDEISALILLDTDAPNRLLFNQLPASDAVTSINAQTVLHVFGMASDWRLDVLTTDERAALTPAAPPATAAVPPLDEQDRELLAALLDDARRPAAALAGHTGMPESTVRRRIAALGRRGALRTQVHVNPRRLGLNVDANLWLQVTPARLDEVGRTLATHPAVHGAVAVTGPANLQIAVWVHDLEHLYQFITRDLGALDVGPVDTMLVGRANKRPESTTRLRG